MTGALITMGFWGMLGPLGKADPIWSWEGGVTGTGVLAGWAGLTLISVVSGLISGVSEALGASYIAIVSDLLTDSPADLGSLDDNLTLPIIAGGCLLGFFRGLQYFFS